MSNFDERTLVRALRALGDAKRFRMVQEIAAAGELSCGDIASRFDLSQPTVSHHLKLLQDAGVLVARQDAKHHFISVDRALLEGVVGALLGKLSAEPKPKKAKKRK